jgi:LytS/YehU family sensor histidine kinase
MVVSLINNISLLLALSICHSLIVQKYPLNSLPYKILCGILFGLVTIAGMMNPFVLEEGIIFDGRSVVASVAGVFGGPITALLVFIIGGTYRWFVVGGAGALMGVFVLATSAILGSLFYELISNQGFQTVI